MPDAVDCDLVFDSKSLKRREDRSRRRAKIAQVNLVGRTLFKLDAEERKLVDAFHSVEMTGTERDPYAWASALCSLTRALDSVRARRRITLGIPLPSANGGKRRLLDMPPAPVRDAVLIPEHPASNGADSAIPTA